MFITRIRVNCLQNNGQYDQYVHRHTNQNACIHMVCVVNINFVKTAETEEGFAVTLKLKDSHLFDWHMTVI